MKRTRGLVTAIAATVMLTTTAIAPAASAAQAGDGWAPTDSEIALLGDFLETYEVPADVQESLLEDAAAGRAWDSLGNAEPVSEKTLQLESETATVQTFEDGSISVTTVDEPVLEPEGISTRKLTGCSATKVGLHKGCKIHFNNGAVSYWFQANYTIKYDAYDQINSVYNPVVDRTLGYTLNSEKLTLLKRNETSTSSPARAEYRIVTNLYPGVSSKTWVLYLSVGANKARQGL